VTLVNVIKQEILEQIEYQIKRIYSINEIPKLVIKLNLNDQFGDFTTTAALQIKSRVNESPMSIAEKVIAYINLEHAKLEKIEVVNPGYINFYIEPKWKISVLGEIIKSNISNTEQDFSQLHKREDINYIIQRIETVIITFAKEGFRPNFGKMLWEHLQSNEERELLNLLVRFTSDMQTLSEVDMNNLLDETIKKFYGYYDKLQFRKLDHMQLNVALNLFLGVKGVLEFL